MGVIWGLESLKLYFVEEERFTPLRLLGYCMKYHTPITLVISGALLLFMLILIVERELSSNFIHHRRLRIVSITFAILFTLLMATNSYTTYHLWQNGKHYLGHYESRRMELAELEYLADGKTSTKEDADEVRVFFKDVKGYMVVQKDDISDEARIGDRIHIITPSRIYDRDTESVISDEQLFQRFVETDIFNTIKIVRSEV